MVSASVIHRPEKVNSMGFQPIQLLAPQLGGNVDVIREGGTRFIIKFPRNEVGRLMVIRFAAESTKSGLAWRVRSRSLGSSVKIR